MSNKFRVLAIDGGGIRGIIPASVLTEIEKRSGKPIYALFDLICGTSTGGILSLGSTVPDPKNPKQAKFTAAELLASYRSDGSTIFSRSIGWKVRTIGGWLGPKYPATGVEAVLQEKVGEAKLSDALTPIIISSYDTNESKPVFFKSEAAKLKPATKDFLMTQVGRSTAAAPTYFPSENIQKIALQNSNVDGGVFVNNPAMCGYAEAVEITKDEKSPHHGKEIFIVSLGTGSLAMPIPYSHSKDLGKLGWISGGNIIGVMSDGVADAVDYQLELALNKVVRKGNDGSRSDGVVSADAAKKNYYRFQLTLAQGHEEMDNVTTANIDYLYRAGNELVSHRKNDLAVVCQVIGEA